MIPLGLGMAWAGYAIGIWGYCLIRGYDVKFTQLFGKTWPGTGKAAPSSGAAPPASSPSTGPATTPVPANGNCPPNYSFDPATGKCVHIIAPGTGAL